MTEDVNTTKSDTDEETKLESEEDSRNFAIRLTLDKRIDLAITVVIVLFGVFLIFEARDIRAGLIPDPITSRGMPYLTGIFCIIGGIILGVMRLMSWSVLPGNLVPGEGHEDEEGHSVSWVRTFSIVATTWISVWLLKSLGYLLATPFFMIVTVWLMGTRNWKKLILFPVLYTLATWFVFSQPLQFILPLGFLTPFFRSLGLTP
jgi:putative tricarboxylic transport membrane protein